MQRHPSRRAVLTLALALPPVAALSLARPVRAAEAPVYTGLFSNLALGGYDPVAYFTQGHPVEGSSSLTTEYEGATWRFAGQENLDRFLADPDAFAPRYGGYCAYAAAKGDAVSADPEIWRIVDGRLYLNYDQDVQKLWDKDVPGFIAEADGNWPGILGD